MKVVIAPDSYKGSLTAMEVANSIEEGIIKYNKNIEVVKVPMADGGEGTVQALVDATGGKIINLKVCDPLLREIDSFYGILGDGKTAIIEMAAASGLNLLHKNELNPLITSTYGTGQILNDAIEKGCRKIIVGLGGSATNDGGAGMLRALGIRFLNKDGRDIPEGGGVLKNLYKIDKKNFNTEILKCETGAAFLVIGAKLESGVDIVIRETNLVEALKDSDIVFTGEGRIDFQTKFGKAPYGVAKEAEKIGLPVIAICGEIGEGYDELYNHGFTSIFSIVNKPMTLEDSIKDSKKLINDVSERVIRLICEGDKYLDRN